MIYIEGLGYIEDRTRRKTEDSHTVNRSSFDAILKSETIIYATPETDDGQTNIEKQLSISDELDGYFKKAACQYNIDEALLKAVARAESNFNAGAVSSAGAVGIMQLMPGTASSLGVSNPYDAEQNIMGGAKYLSSLLDKYNQNISLALAAYNAGSGNVDKYGGIPPFTETQNYVNRVLSYMGDNQGDAHTVYAQAAGDASTDVYTISAVPDRRI